MILYVVNIFHDHLNLFELMNIDLNILDLHNLLSYIYLIYYLNPQKFCI